MRNAICVALGALLLTIWGCTESDSEAAPKISTDVCPAYYGPISTESVPSTFNLMIINNGDDDLEISDVQFVGDERSAYTWFGPDKSTVEKNEPVFIEVTYDPPSAGIDTGFFVIQSNAGNAAEFVYPLCSQAVAPGDEALEYPGLDSLENPTTSPLCGGGEPEES